MYEKSFKFMRKRILNYLEYMGITKYRFYKETGLSNGYLDKDSDIALDSYEKISSHYPDLNMEWVRTGEGEMLKPTAVQQVEGNRGVATQVAGDLPPVRKIVGNEVEVVPMEQYVEVPFYDLSATAGMPSGDVQQTGWLETRLIPRQYAGREYAVIRISGDSMDDGTSRSLCHGDEIIVKQELVDHMTPLPIRSKLFVVDTLEGAVVKQIVELNKVEGYVVLHSFNERYPDYQVPLSEVRGFYSVQCFSLKSIRF